MAENLTLKIAAFVAQALDLADRPAVLAEEIVTLKRDANAGIFSIQLDSTIGPAAFLIYHYALSVVDGQGRTGRSLFDADLAVLERAAEQDAPGPRILAHALAGDEAFILATTPATYRALTGAGPLDGLEATSADLLPGADSERTRRAAAAELLRLLRAADAQAADWLRAIQTESRLKPASEDDADALLSFNEEETALALYLLDERSIQHLLQVLNQVLGSARRQAAQAMGEEPPG